jgi:cytochrome bd ubiquinol oxidase subunit II
MQATSPEFLAELLALVALSALILYAVLGGADFGGGVWNLLARGPRSGEQRRAIGVAMGPVWEANHVWLIFVIVLLFSAWPPAFAALSIALFWPLHLVLVGIVLRGSAFVFRAHGHAAARAPLFWGRVFGAASVVTPFLLGACLAVVSTGAVRVEATDTVRSIGFGWIAPFPVATGLLALLLCAYLAAVYLTVETEGVLREDFRSAALVTWLIAGVVSIGTLLLTWSEAPRLWSRLTSAPIVFVIVAGISLAPASAHALWQRSFRRARVLAVSQVVLLLLGWAFAQWPFIIYPDVNLVEAASPAATLRLILWSLPFGLAVLLPSLWYLFRVFKGRNPAPETEPPRR